MPYIDLNLVTKEHLTGSWYIETRLNNKPGADDLFRHNNFLQLDADGNFISRNGTEVLGTWEMKKEYEIIYNPQISFFRDAENVGEAIVTRLLEQTEREEIIHRLTLYFSTGLELVLKKNRQDSPAAT
jgi:hypothetical protein